MDFREKGLMCEAMKEVIAYGFNEMNLNRVDALVADYNTASLKTIERLNFIQEGRETTLLKQREIGRFARFRPTQG